MRQHVYRHLILPAYETVLHRRKNFRYWKELERSQWLPRADVERIQFDHLRRLIAHASENCPYYRETWAAGGLSPAALKTPGDFRKWPVIGREQILEHRLRLRAAVPGLRLITKSTSGSTGAPLFMDYDTGSEERRYGAWYRGYAWGGAAPGAKQLWLWAKPLGNQPWAKAWKDRLYAGVYRRRVLNTFELTDERVPDFAAAINRYRPDTIVSYTNPIYTLAKEIEARGIVVWSPDSVVVGAEKLYGFQREVIERVFGCPVFETYGAREFMLIAAECDRHEGLHLTTEHLLVEVLNDDGTPTPDGQEGNVVITDLFNYGMPMIRYRNNDRAVAGWTQCSCGRGLPLMRPPTGRTLDIVTTPDGRRLPGEFFPYLLNNYQAVRRYQVVQDTPDHFEIRLVTTPGWNDASRIEIEARVRQLAGPTVRFEIALVDDIPVTSAGKFQVVVNKTARTDYRAS